MKLKCWLIYTPLDYGLHAELGPSLMATVNPAQSPGPAKAHQVPRAPLPTSGVTFCGVSSCAHQRALPLLHRSYWLMRQTKSLPPTSDVALYGGSLQVVVSPCWEMALPDVISTGLSLDAWTPTPVGFYGALTRFFP